VAGKGVGGGQSLRSGGVGGIVGAFSVARDKGGVFNGSVFDGSRGGQVGGVCQEGNG